MAPGVDDLHPYMRALETLRFPQKRGGKNRVIRKKKNCFWPTALNRR